MFNRKYTGLLTGILNSFIMSATLVVVMTYVNTGGLLIKVLLITFIEAFVISFIVSSIIPLGKIGLAFSNIFKVKPNGIVFVLLFNIPSSIIMVLILSFCITLFSIGFVSYLIPAWLGSLPIGFVTTYVVLVLITPFVRWLTNL